MAADYDLMGINDTIPTTVTADINATSGKAAAPVWNDDGTLKTAGNVAYVNDTTNGLIYPVVALDDATNKLVDANGKVVAYVGDAVALGQTMYYYTATQYTNIGDACGQIKKDGDTKFYAYTDKKGVLHVGTLTTADATASNNVLVDGEVKKFEEKTLNLHVFVDVLDADKKVTGVKCDLCGATYAKAANLEVKNAVALSTLGVMKFGETGCDYLVNATTATSTTVESAKTFDAGIALYAGMALASVAGSAVVIGKKKEF